MEKNLPDESVDISSFDNVSLETDVAQGMFFEAKRSRVIHNFTKELVSGYKHIEKSK